MQPLFLLDRYPLHRSKLAEIGLDDRRPWGAVSE